MKARNGQAVLDVMADVPLATQRAFERDYALACRDHPNDLVRTVLRKAGRRYAAVGWRVAYEAVSGPRRLRRPPALGELRLRQLVTEYLEHHSETDRMFAPTRAAYERLMAFLSAEQAVGSTAESA